MLSPAFLYLMSATQSLMHASFFLPTFSPSTTQSSSTLLLHHPFSSPLPPFSLSLSIAPFFSTHFSLSFFLFLLCSTPPGQEKIFHSLFDECLPLLAACMMGYTNADDILKVCVCVCVCVYVRVCVCVCMYVCMCVYVCVM